MKSVKSNLGQKEGEGVILKGRVGPSDLSLILQQAYYFYSQITLICIGYSYC